MNATEASVERSFFLVFDRGDDVLSTIRDFAQKNKIRGGHFAAIGALQRGVIAWWNPETRQYDRIELEEQLEVSALLGDIAIEGTKTKVHAHVVLGRRDGQAVAGHLLEGTVFPTLEMHFVAFAAVLERRKDEETNLSLIALA